jgi:hypothetical protein
MLCYDTQISDHYNGMECVKMSTHPPLVITTPHSSVDHTDIVVAQRYGSYRYCSSTAVWIIQIL